MIEAVVANSKSRVSPLYQAYKARVLADSGTMALGQFQARTYFEPLKHGVLWFFIACGSKPGRLHTIWPNTSAGDIAFSRASKATVINASGQLVEIDANVPGFSYRDGQLIGVSVSPQSTNMFTNSVNTTYSGSSPATLESPYIWPFTSLYTHSRYFPPDGATHRAFKTASVGSGTYCFSCFMLMDDGSEPRPGIDFQVNLNATMTTTTGVKKVAGNVYRVWGCLAITGGTLFGIQRTMPGHSGKSFRVTGFQLNEGNVPLNHVVTSGTSATKLFEATETPQVVPMQDIVMFADMTNSYVMGSSSLPMGFTLRQDPANFLTIGFTSSGVIAMAIVLNNNVVLQITSIYTSGKIAARFRQGAYALCIDGIFVAAFTAGTINTANPLLLSSTVQLGHSNRNIAVMQAAVTTAGSDDDLIRLTT